MDITFSYQQGEQMQVSFNADISFDLYVQVISLISQRDETEVRQTLLGMTRIMKKNRQVCMTIENTNGDLNERMNTAPVGVDAAAVFQD